MHVTLTCSALIPRTVEGSGLEARAEPLDSDKEMIVKYSFFKDEAPRRKARDKRAGRRTVRFEN